MPTSEATRFRQKQRCFNLRIGKKAECMDAKGSREIDGIWSSGNSLVIASKFLSEIKVYPLRMRKGKQSRVGGKEHY